MINLFTRAKQSCNMDSLFNPLPKNIEYFAGDDFPTSDDLVISDTVVLNKVLNFSFSNNVNLTDVQT